MSHKVRAELCYASHLSHCLNFKPHSKSSLAPRTVALVVIRLRYVGGRSHSKSQQSTDKRVLILIFRDSNYPAIFIPRGFEESGNGNLSFLGDRGNKSLSPGFRVGVRGNLGVHFVSDSKLI